jgi:hypothetical protein
MTGRIIKGAFQAREQYSTPYTSTVAGTVRYKGFLLVTRRRLAGPDDWQVGPVTTFLQGRHPVSRRAQRRVVAVALARQQPDLVLEFAGIRNLRPMFATLWLQEEHLEVNGGYR